VSLLIAWTLLAFGGVYSWAAQVAAAGSVGVAILALRPPLLSRSPHLRTLDALLAASVLCAAFHLLPLPPRLLALLSPQAATLTAAMSLAPPGGWRPLSIAPEASGHALLVAAAALLTFWSARAIFRFGGIRTVTRSIAFWGSVAALVGILQDASRSRLVYWWWAPAVPGPLPFGPFINRNHFAAWALMAIAVSLGYLAARTHARDEMDRYRSFFSRFRRRLDGRTVWLLAAVALMSIALVLTLSRSALAGAAVAAIVAHLLSARRIGRRRRHLWVGAAVVLAMAILWTGPATLVGRWQSAEMGQEGRSVIWRETMPLVRDFWLTGTGVGTYGNAMKVYQTSDREVHFNQAHNHYLQVLAEGGVLLAGLLGGAFIALLLAARARMGQDRTGMLWLRVGAAAGLTGLVVQSFWESAGRMPANALLAAILAAIALHETHHHERRPGGERAPV
jgi:O-antigen ligase